MKTYILTAPTEKAPLTFIATQAKNKKEAFEKVKKVYPNVTKSGILVSSVHIDFCNSCEKVI